MVDRGPEEEFVSTGSIVCGLHRSGTTFVGQILRKAGVFVVHEPLNERFGMAGVPIAYPYAEENNDSFAGLIDDAVFLARPWNKDVAYIQAKGLHRQIYALTGGRSGLRWGWLRLRRNLGVFPEYLCLKDPFMTLATPYLIKHHGLKTVCLIRHPAAIHYSTEKQSWRFGVKNLLQQPELITRYGSDIPDEHWRQGREHAAASIAVLWKLMIRINAPLAKEGGRLLMITHEALCMEPQETASKIFAHLQIPFTSTIAQFVADHAGGDRAEAINGKTHDFKRNSKAIPSAWKGKLSEEDEKVIVDIAGEEIFKVYGPT